MNNDDTKEKIKIEINKSSALRIVLFKKLRGYGSEVDFDFSKIVPDIKLNFDDLDKIYGESQVDDWLTTGEL